MMIRDSGERKYLPPDAQIIIARQKRFYSKLIYRAICDIVNYRNTERREFIEHYKSAVEWMYNGTDVNEDKSVQVELRVLDDAMSFDTACNLLGWDPDWVRLKVKKLTKKDLEHIGRNGLI